jgi:hypothetical protein
VCGNRWFWRVRSGQLEEPVFFVTGSPVELRRDLAGVG